MVGHDSFDPFHRGAHVAHVPAHDSQSLWGITENDMKSLFDVQELVDPLPCCSWFGSWKDPQVSQILGKFHTSRCEHPWLLNVVKLSLDILLISTQLSHIVPPSTVSHVFYESYPIGSHGGELSHVIPLIQVTLPPDFTERLQKCERQNQDLEAPAWEHLVNHEGPTVDICDVA